MMVNIQTLFKDFKYVYRVMYTLKFLGQIG